MDTKRFIITFISLLLNLSLVRNTYANYDSLIVELDKAIELYDDVKTLKVSNEGLALDNISKAQKLNFEIGTIKALDISGMNDLVIQKSNKLFKTKSFTKEQEINLRLIRAVAFEILQDTTKCINELERVENLFNYVDKSLSSYGLYLYRRCSFLRVNDRDKLALEYANLAIAHGEKYNYISNLATSYMLKAYLTIANDEVGYLYLINKSLNEWRKIDAKNEYPSLYLSLSNFYSKKNNTKKAILYADSTILYKDLNPVLYVSSYAYKLKSEIYQKQNKNKLALAAYKKYIEYSEAAKFKEQSLKVKELELANNEKIAALKNKQLTKEKKESDKRLNYLLFILAILFITTSVISILSYQINKNKKQILMQKNALEDSLKSLDSSYKEKTFLLKEVNHRVKNNLSLIVDLIEHHIFLEQNSSLKKKFEDLSKRINAMVLAQSDMYLSKNLKEKGEKSIKEYTQTLIESIIGIDIRNIKLETNIADILLDIDNLIPIGLILNELISNTLKYAKPLKEDILTIHIDIIIDQKKIILIYSDNGVSVEINHSEEKGIGLFILEGMIRQLKGSIENNNFKYTIELATKN